MSQPAVIGGNVIVAFAYIGTQSNIVADVSEGHTFVTGKTVELVERMGWDATAVKRCPTRFDGTLSASLFSLGHNLDTSTPGTRGVSLGFGATPGDLTYFAQLPVASTDFTININENTEEVVSGSVDGHNSRGIVMHDARSSPETSPGNGIGVQFGSLFVSGKGSSATQTAVLQVVLLAFAGTDIIFQVETDATDDFTGSETDIFTTPLTMTAPAHSQINEVPGLNTDTWFQLAFTGTFTSASFLAYFAIEGV